MPSVGDLDYAQARLQARHGQTLRAPDWSRLEGSRDLQHFLSTAATTPLVQWTHALHAEMGPHDLERSLRREWRDYVGTIATWLPGPWQRVIRWSGVLPDLQYVARLAEPEACPAWMFADPVFGELAPGGPAERAAAVRDSELAPFAAAVLGLESVDRAWYAHWRALLPAMPEETRSRLQCLERIVRSRATRARQIEDSLQPALETLKRRLDRLFRTAAGTPVSALAHLALQALEIEELRGRVAALAAFGATGRAE